MTACVINTWGQGLAIAAFAMLAGFFIKVKVDHPE